MLHGTNNIIIWQLHVATILSYLTRCYKNLQEFKKKVWLNPWSGVKIASIIPLLIILNMD